MTKNAEKLRFAATKALDSFESKLFAGQRKIGRSRKSAESDEPERKFFGKFGLRDFLVGSISLVFIAGFIVAVNFYSTTVTRLENHPLVVNLSKAGLLARVSFAESPCEGNDSNCFTARSFDDSTWPTVKVPRVTLNHFPGFVAHSNQGWVYYRFHVPFTPEQIRSGLPLSFSPVYVSHQRYSIFVNGRLADVGGGSPSISSMVNISIPADDIIDGFATVVFKGSIEPNDFGITHARSLYSGPKEILDSVYVVRERSMNSYYLLFLFTKGSIFIVFTLFFFFTSDRRALFHFLMYAFFVTAENLFVGNFLESHLDILVRVPIFFSVKTFAACAILSFFVEYFQAFRARSLVLRLNLVFILLVAGLTFDFSAGSHTVTSVHLMLTTNVFLVCVLVIGLIMGLMAVRLWSNAAVDRKKITGLVSFSVVTGLYLGLICWEFFFNEYLGFDKRAVFDLLFFYYIAFITAKEFGFNQGQVITLEGHMEEKARMEQELLEAAEIAKAFMPGLAPNWSFCHVKVFHRSLSESSGDWFTFEESPSKRLYHVLMCDITGHGVQAAIVVSTCRTVLSAMLADNPALFDQPDFIARYATSLNQILFKQGGGRHVTTLLGMTLEPETGTLHYLCAGHPMPLHIVKEIESGGGRGVKPLVSRLGVLGVHSEVLFQTKSTKLALGDEVLAFTDGLPVTAHLRTFKKMVAEGSSQQDLDPRLVYQQIWSAETAKSKVEPNDDVSIVWLRRVA